MTIQLHDSYDFALEKLSTATGLLIRIDNGRLIAVSRPFKVPPVAPALPEEFRNARRILLGDYHREASNPPPLSVRVTWRGAEACYRANFRSGEGRLLDIPLPGSDTAGSVVVALVDYDPIWKTSYVAVEGPRGELERVFALGTTGTVSFSSGSGDGSLRVVTSTDADGSCPEGRLGSAAGTSPVTVRLEGRSVGEGKPSRLLLAPRPQTKTGTVFKTFSGGPEPDSGEQKAFVVS